MERDVEGVDGGVDAEGIVADDLVESGEQFTLDLLVEMKDGRLRGGREGREREIGTLRKPLSSGKHSPENLSQKLAKPSTAHWMLE